MKLTGTAASKTRQAAISSLDETDLPPTLVLRIQAEVKEDAEAAH